jgi:iron complex outermembrane receptor protein
VISDDSFTDVIEINKMKLDGYTTLGATAGVTGDNWTAELFASNLTNEYAELSGSFVYDRERITPDAAADDRLPFLLRLLGQPET